MAEFDHGTKRIAEAAGGQLARIAGIDCASWELLESTLPVTVELLADRAFLATKPSDQFVTLREVLLWDEKPEPQWDAEPGSMALYPPHRRSHRGKCDRCGVKVVSEKSGEGLRWHAIPAFHAGYGEGRDRVWPAGCQERTSG